MTRLVLPVALMVLMGAGCTRECIKSHEEMVHHPSWVQFIQSGKTMIPIIHPARDNMETICDEYAR